MKLKKLIKDLPSFDIKGSKEIEITGLSSNSQLVAPGNLFIAKRGRTLDGSQFIPEAVEAGAVAVLTDMYDPTLKSVTQLIYKKPEELEALLAKHYYQAPASQLLTVGVTGTNGKTTTTFLIKHLLDAAKQPCGLIGSIEYIIGQHRYQATRTTPDIITNYKLFKEMLNEGCHSAVMEVSSHALDQKRVEYLEFDIAIYTNLTLDHLDYHESMQAYAEAKKKLFSHLKTASQAKVKSPTAIINVDCSWAEFMQQGLKSSVLTYGIDNPADLRAKNILFSPKGTEFTLQYQDKTYQVKIPLVGKFNVLNTLAAFAAGLVCQLPLEAMIEQAKSFPSVPGRLQVVPNEKDLNIFVDSAHSHDALKNVLECLREIKKGRLITVFGCGGDRDKSKRPKMAYVSESFSDIVIVTSDNPRSENPHQICNDIMQGFVDRHTPFVELDRRLAIEKAIALASENDIILIAGKGHETYQVFAHQTIEFDDVKVAQELCQKSSCEAALR